MKASGGQFPLVGVVWLGSHHADLYRNVGTPAVGGLGRPGEHDLPIHTTLNQLLFVHIVYSLNIFNGVRCIFHQSFV